MCALLYLMVQTGILQLLIYDYSKMIDALQEIILGKQAELLVLRTFNVGT